MKGTSLVVPWLRVHASIAGDKGWNLRSCSQNKGKEERGWKKEAEYNESKKEIQACTTCNKEVIILWKFCFSLYTSIVSLNINRF